jgi:hypothetical protein
VNGTVQQLRYVLFRYSFIYFSEVLIFINFAVFEHHFKICESFINKKRECVETRGCATKEECQSSGSSTGYYDGNEVQVIAF